VQNECFYFVRFFSLFLAFMKQKRRQKEKKKMSKIPPLPYMSMSAFISGAAKKEYKINIAIE